MSRRVVLEHGLIANILSGLGLVHQLTIANICKRTYRITVPWNTVIIKQVINEDSKHFPKIDEITDDFVCKSEEVYIDGEKGKFYGSFDKKTN
jgi:hypothetical protein